MHPDLDPVHDHDDPLAEGFDIVIAIDAIRRRKHRPPPPTLRSPPPSTTKHRATRPPSHWSDRPGQTTPFTSVDETTLTYSGTAADGTVHLRHDSCRPDLDPVHDRHRRSTRRGRRYHCHRDRRHHGRRLRKHRRFGRQRFGHHHGNDEAPGDTATVSLVPASVTEGDTTTPSTVSVDETPVARSTVTLTYSGTAADGTDHRTSATILAGQTSTRFTIDTIDDPLAEGADAIDAITGGGFENIAASAANASVTTTINDEAPGDTATVSLVGPASVTEGDTTTPFTVSVDETPVADITVTLTYSGTAADGTDFTGIASATILAGQTSTRFTIDTIDDPLAEGAEDIVIAIDAITGGGFENIAASAANASVTTTINDEAPGDTATVSLVGPASVTEGDTTTPFTVSVDETPVADITVTLTYSGTAADGTDFTGIASATILAGRSNVHPVHHRHHRRSTRRRRRRHCHRDRRHHGRRLRKHRRLSRQRFGHHHHQRRSTGRHGHRLTGRTGQRHRRRHDHTVSRLASMPHRLQRYVRSRSAIAERPIEGTDFTGVTSVPRSCRQDTRGHNSLFETFDDPLAEGAEDIVIEIVAVSGGGFEEIDTDPAGNSLTTSLLDNDGTPTLTIGDVSVTEDVDSHAVFRVALTNPSASDTDFVLSLSSGTATFGADFGPGIEYFDGSSWQNVAGSLTISAAETEIFVRTTVADDLLADSGETFTLEATILTSNTVNGAVAGTGTINDEATADVATVSLTGPSSITEGDTSTPYTVSVDSIPATDITINLLYSGTAADGTDYTGVASATISAGSASGQFLIGTIDDALLEISESFTVEIASVSGGGFESIVTHNTDNSVTTTINDETTGDTALVSLTGPSSVEEGDSTTPYSLSLSETPVSEVTIALSYSGTATDGVDFSGVTTVAISPGSTSSQFTLSTIDDPYAETAEDIVIEIVAVSGGGFENIAEDPTDNRVTTTILDEPIADTVRVSIAGPGSVAEGSTTDPYTVSIDSPAARDVLVTLSYTGTAIDGTDFSGTTSVTIPAGSADTQFDISTIDDSLAEGTESVVVSIDGVSGGGFENIAVDPSADSITTTIVDDDNAPSVDVPVRTQATNDNDSVYLDLSGNFSDADGDTLTFTATGLPPGLTLDLTSGIISGTVDHSASQGGPFSDGIYPITLTISDGTNDTVVNFDYEVSNPVPVTTDDTAVTIEEIPVTLDVLTNDFDPDGDTLVVISTSVPANGMVVVNPDNTLTYTPFVGFIGTELIHYTIDDGDGGTASGSVEISVIPANNPPIAADDSYAPAEDANIVGNVLTDDTGSGPDTDPDGHPIVLTEINGDPLLVGQTITLPGGATLRVNSDGSFSFNTNGAYDDLAQGETAVETFTYTIADPEGATDSGRTVITIHGLNEAPIATGENVETPMNTPITVDVLDNDTDSNGDPLAVVLLGQPANGSAIVNPDGTITFTPDPAYIGPVVVNYLVEDPHGGSDTAQLRINVTTEFTWDSFNDFSKGFDKAEIDAGQFNNRMLSQEIFSLAAEPIFSGYARPGTEIIGRIYDESGTLIGESKSVSDPGGNWMMQFQGIDTHRFHRIEVEQVSGASDMYGYLGLDPADSTYQTMQPLTAYGEKLSINSVFRNRSGESLKTLHEENNAPSGFGRGTLGQFRLR